MNWGMQALAFLPNASWAVGAWLVGSKRRIGFVISFVSEAFWLWLSIASHLWSIIPWCFVGFAFYARAWWKWGRSSG